MEKFKKFELLKDGYYGNNEKYKTLIFEGGEITAKENNNQIFISFSDETITNIEKDIKKTINEFKNGPLEDILFKPSSRYKLKFDKPTSLLREDEFYELKETFENDNTLVFSLVK